VTTKLELLEKAEEEAARRVEEARREAQRITAAIPQRVKSLREDRAARRLEEVRRGEAEIREEIERLRTRLTEESEAEIEALRERREELAAAATDGLRSAVAGPEA